MRRFAAFIIALVLTFTGTAILYGTAADAATCSIYGAQTATWGCGRITANSRTSTTVRVQDTKTDGRCIRVKIKTGGSWVDTGTSHCSSNPGTYSISGYGQIDGVRIYKGWTGWYRTLS